MRQPEGSLTGIQLQIMEVIWKSGDEGIQPSEIWQELSAKRAVARTTVLTMVTRLEKRGWLLRFGEERATRYRAACSKENAANRLAAGFVDEFFGGSASQLVMSLLGSKQLNPEEINRLRTILSEASEK
jgi:predicted transcriptional regulator